MPIEFVFFDVGETLVDETRIWRAWADYLGVRHATFFDALDEVIAARQHHEEVFRRLRPAFDLRAALRGREARGDLDVFTAADLYPDAAPCLRALRSAGFEIGVAGNAAPSGGFLAGLTTDIATSGVELGAQKPAPAFFEALAALAGVPADRIAYVGDRVDNDVIPAREAGMLAAFIERGPWGRAHAARPEAGLADVRMKSLAELTPALRRV